MYTAGRTRASGKGRRDKWPRETGDHNGCRNVPASLAWAERTSGAAWLLNVPVHLAPATIHKHGEAEGEGVALL